MYIDYSANMPIIIVIALVIIYIIPFALFVERGKVTLFTDMFFHHMHMVSGAC